MRVRPKRWTVSCFRSASPSLGRRMPLYHRNCVFSAQVSVLSSHCAVVLKHSSLTESVLTPSQTPRQRLEVCKAGILIFVVLWCEQHHETRKFLIDHCRLGWKDHLLLICRPYCFVGGVSSCNQSQQIVIRHLLQIQCVLTAFGRLGALPSSCSCVLHIDL